MKVGAIAYQNVADSIKLCFVSSRRHRNTLTLPKGIVKFNEKLTKAATRELFEEAGVSGKVKRKAYPLLFVSKKPEIDDVLYFFVKIQNVSQNWPEAGLRRRVFLTLDEALYRTTSQSTQKIISLLMNVQRPQADTKQVDMFNVPLFGNARRLNKVSST
jgi:ADP-ribose pyrophosphatase YjhB (NUDIX family)